MMTFDELIHHLNTINPVFASLCAKQGINGTGSPDDEQNPDGVPFYEILTTIASNKHLTSDKKDQLLSELILNGVDGYTPFTVKNKTTIYTRENFKKAFLNRDNFEWLRRKHYDLLSKISPKISQNMDFLLHRNALTQAQQEASIHLYQELIHLQTIASWFAATDEYDEMYRTTEFSKRCFESFESYQDDENFEEIVAEFLSEPFRHLLFNSLNKDVQRKGLCLDSIIHYFVTSEASLPKLKL